MEAATLNNKGSHLRQEPRGVKSNFFGEDLTILLKSCFQE